MREITTKSQLMSEELIKKIENAAMNMEFVVDLEQIPPLPDLIVEMYKERSKYDYTECDIKEIQEIWEKYDQFRRSIEWSVFDEFNLFIANIDLCTNKFFSYFLDENTFLPYRFFNGYNTPIHFLYDRTIVSKNPLCI